ncbi:MAG: hypothetical protein ACKO7P_12640 [Bacteroidota bacterium]
MQPLSFRKYEKSISEYATMIDNMLEDWAWEAESPMYQKALFYKNRLSEKLYPERATTCTIKELISHELAWVGVDLPNLLTLLIKEYPFHFSPFILEWYLKDSKIGETDVRTCVYEDPRMPFYYILHVDLFQDYMLLHKGTGRLLDLRWHDICPSPTPSIINGRLLTKQFADFDFCSLKIDDHTFGIEPSVSIINIEEVKLYDQLIIPTDTNVDYIYIPCKREDDFYFNQKIVGMLKSNYNGCLKVREDNNSDNTIVTDDFDDLPF